MKFIIQRVLNAQVKTEERLLADIGRGYLVLIGIQDSDTKETADKMIQKMIKLRIFADEKGKTNLSLADVGGSLLLVSQFTLYADCRKGNRPSFIQSAAPEYANQLYRYIIEICRNNCPDVQQGEFGAHMEVSLINDGPFTIVLDSDTL